MKKLCSGVILSASLLWAASCVGADELGERRAVAQTVRQALFANDFKKLEDLSTTYRNDKSRTASGLWKSSLFYAGLDSALYAPDGDAAPFFADLEVRTGAWAEAYPTSPAARIAHSMMLVSRAWHERGGGYASSVQPEAWATFEHYIQLARENLERHKTIASIDARWYEEMLIIARAEGWDRPRFESLLKEALDREPGFYQTYFMALLYLLPKWHGNLVEIENFAQQAVMRTAKHEGTGLYARIYWYAAQAQFGNALFGQSLAFWPKMKAGFDDVIARYPDTWNLNNYAKFACLAGDRQKTRDLMERIEGSIVAEAWDPVFLYAQCREWSSSDAPPSLPPHR
jgi:hypothetical protein